MIECRPGSRPATREVQEMEPRSSEDPSMELERMAEEQINDLDSESEERTRRSKQRRERVLTLYGQGALRSAPDNYFAALIMLYGDDVAHFELARTFAKRATVLGEPRAWSVVAAAWDRALLGRGQPAARRWPFRRSRWPAPPRCPADRRILHTPARIWRLGRHCCAPAR